MRWVCSLPVLVSLALGPAEPVSSVVAESFPGLAELIRQADAILVVDPVEPKPADAADTGRCLVAIRGTIKAEPAMSGTIAVSLRSAPLQRSPGASWSLAGQGLAAGKRYIVFLKRGGPADKPQYASLPYEGGHMEITPGPELPLSWASTPEGILTLLLRDFFEHKQREFWSVEAPLRGILYNGHGSTSVRPDRSRVRWVQQCLKDFQSIKPDMTRREVQMRFPQDGGCFYPSLMRFVHPQCNCFKIDVTFACKRDSKEGGRMIYAPDDPVTEVSKPYIELAFMD